MISRSSRPEPRRATKTNSGLGLGSWKLTTSRILNLLRLKIRCASSLHLMSLLFSCPMHPLDWYRRLALALYPQGSGRRPGNTFADAPTQKSPRPRGLGHQKLCQRLKSSQTRIRFLRYVAPLATHTHPRVISGSRIDRFWKAKPPRLAGLRLAIGLFHPCGFGPEQELSPKGVFAAQQRRRQRAKHT
uniref:Uncharacterized protein n=1 Tax=Caulerpa ashmeadii TaxID=177078 RepID=A0A6B9VX38_9CHLO|nr:hypothetical protein [Caulerpa ashmeadii]QHQ73215.1 hypothetical protein [Caulerpa ashmeadii]